MPSGGISTMFAPTLTGESTGTRVGLGCRVVVEVASVNVLRGHLDLKLLHVSGSAS
ncbi:MAG: hypothetical protein ACLTSX_02870 [Collinsella sp.]